MLIERTRRAGLTLLEVALLLLIALVVVGLLAMLLVRHRATDARMHCVNNLRRIGAAIHTYSDGTSLTAAQRRLPPSRIEDGYATWGVLLMPHLDSKSKLIEWQTGKTYFDQATEPREAVVAPYFCPARSRDGVWLSKAWVDWATAHHHASASCSAQPGCG